MKNAKINSRIRTIFSKPGEPVLVEEETLTTTVLGSCVPLVLHNARTGMVGLCHAELPQANTAKDGYHFVTRHFSGRDQNTVVWRGGHIQGRAKSTWRRTENIAATHNILKHYNLKSEICNTGSLLGRKPIFYTNSGLVQVNLPARQTEATTRNISREFPRVRLPLSTSSLHRHPE